MILLVWLAGCEYHTDILEQPGKDDIFDEKVQIEIFTRANSYQLPSTRADEDKVEMTPWVLVFKGDGGNATFVEAVQAFEMAGRRYVILTKQPAGSNYQLLILANPSDEFYYGDAVGSTSHLFDKANLTSVLTAGITLDNACKKLLTKPLSGSPLTVIPYSGATETIPMSVSLTVDRIDNTTRIEGPNKSALQLIRSVAKMMVANKADNFELTGITAILNVPRQGRLHNLDGSVMDNTSNLTEYRYDGTYAEPLVKADPITGGQSTAKKPIYLYESDIQNNTYVIIQGKYNNKPYYYKMAIVDTNLQAMKLLRNQAYTFTIVAAKGPGYGTVEDAKVSKPSNMDLDFEITVDDSNAYDIMANNEFFLGVSNSVFIAYTNEKGKTYEAFKLVTNCETEFPNASSITDNRGEVEGAFKLNSPSGRIPIVTGGISSPRTTPVEVTIENWLQYNEVGQENNGVPKVNAYITLKLGNLEKQVHIRHREAIKADGTMLYYMPTGTYQGPWTSYVDYFCLTGRVEDGDDQPKTWIKLRPSTGANREDTDNIIVEDGRIFIEILPNTTSKARRGIVHLTTISPDGSSMIGSSVKRIKIDITQLGQLNVNTK